MRGLAPVVSKMTVSPRAVLLAVDLADSVSRPSRGAGDIRVKGRREGCDSSCQRLPRRDAPWTRGEFGLKSPPCLGPLLNQRQATKYIMRSTGCMQTLDLFCVWSHLEIC